MKRLLISLPIILLTACASAPTTSPKEYRASVECTALLNLAIGLQQQDRNIPDAELAGSRNAWIRKATAYESFSQQQFKADVAQLGNAVVKKYNGNLQQKNLTPLVNRCLLR